MAQGNAVSYRVSRNGSGGDWYWEVSSDGAIIARGLAPTRSEARAAALQIAPSHVHVDYLEDYDAPLVDDGDVMPNEGTRQSASR